MGRPAGPSVLQRFLDRPCSDFSASAAECGKSRRSAAAIAEIGPPCHNQRSLPFRHNEIPRLCLNVLRALGMPCTSGRLPAAILAAKGLDPADAALAGVVVQRVRLGLGCRRGGA